MESKAQYIDGEITISSATIIQTPDTPSIYQRSRVATDTHGNSIIVWQKKNVASYLEPAGSEQGGIFGQRIDADGNFIGDRFLIYHNSDGDQISPDVAVDINGNFTVVWLAYDALEENGIIYGQRYNADGTVNGSIFQISASFRLGYINTPRIKMNAAGAFVVCWTERGADITARSYSSLGIPATEPSLIIQTINSPEPEVAIDANGNFIVVWEEITPAIPTHGDGDGAGVFGMRFNSSSAPMSEKFQINTQTAGHQGRPKIAMDMAGNFLVSWYSGHNKSDIRAQSFSDAGIKVGDEFSVLDLPENISIFSAYELNSNYDGLTTFIWHGYAPEGGSDYAYLRNFQLDGTPLSTSYPIIPSGTSEHHVAINNNGQIVVTWGEDRQGIRNDSTNLNDLKYYISASINPVEYIPPSTSGGSGGGGCSLNQKSEYDPLFFILIITSMMYIHRRRFSHYKIKSSQQI